MVDLGDVYDFTGTGRYEISYNVSSYDLFDEKGTPAKGKDALASDTISVKAAGRAGKGKPTPASSASWSRPDRLQRVHDRTDSQR